MASTDNNDDNQFEIPLKLSKMVEDSKIIQKFVIDPNDKYVKLRLNSKYNPPISLDVSINTINEKNGWEKFANKFRDLRKIFKNLDYDHNIWIYSTVNDNGSLIRSYVNQQQQQQQPDQHEQREEEQQQQESTTEEQIPFIEWSIKLVEKYTNLQKEILNLIPELWEPTEFALSVRTILRIKNITLPFAGIVLGPSGGFKNGHC